MRRKWGNLVVHWVMPSIIDGRILPPSLVHADALGHIRLATVLVELRTLSTGDRHMLVQWAVVLPCIMDTFAKTVSTNLGIDYY